MQQAEFTLRYVQAGGSSNSARSYVSYLNRAERLAGDLDTFIAEYGGTAAIEWFERQPVQKFDGLRNRRDTLSAIRKYVNLIGKHCFSACPHPADDRKPQSAAIELTDLLRDARTLGARYYRLTGKPLGVTGEVAELAAAEKIGVELTVARQPGFDGWIDRGSKRMRVQIKGRAVSAAFRYRGRCPAIRFGNLFDICLLVLLDRSTLEPMEIWEADEHDIIARLTKPGSKARNERGSLGISQFKTIARKVWSQPNPV